MSTSLNQHRLGTLLSNTIQNPKIYSHCLSITTQNHKATIDPHMLEVDKVRNDVIDLYNVPKDDTQILVISVEMLQKTKDVEKSVKTDNEKRKEVEPILKTIPGPLPPFPQILKKK